MQDPPEPTAVCVYNTVADAAWQSEAYTARRILVVARPELPAAGESTPMFRLLAARSTLITGVALTTIKL